MCVLLLLYVLLMFCYTVICFAIIVCILSNGFSYFVLPLTCFTILICFASYVCFAVLFRRSLLFCHIFVFCHCFVFDHFVVIYNLCFTSHVFHQWFMSLVMFHHTFVTTLVIFTSAPCHMFHHYMLYYIVFCFTALWA